MENYLDFIGYLASFIIFVSLIMRSVKRLRLINLVGATIFIVYGYLIASMPIMLMNAGIVIINIVYIRQMLKTEDFFTIQPLEKNDNYLKAFLDFYHQDIQKAMHFNDAMLQNSSFRYLILRNMIPAGVFIVETYDKDTLEVTLDFATPAYQDFKTSAHVFKKASETFKAEGYKRFITTSSGIRHQKYLLKMGFKQKTKGDLPLFEKTI